LIPSVVVHYLDVGGPNFSPYKADAPLVIDSDTVLPLPIVFQRLQVIPRWRFQEGQCLRRVKLGELALGDVGQSLESTRALSLVKRLSVLAPE